MIAYLRQTAAETHFMVRLPEEVDFTLEAEERILRNIRKSDKDLMLAAFDGDRVVGNVGVHIFHDRTKVRSPFKSWHCHYSGILQLRSGNDSDGAWHRFCKKGRL